MSRYPPSGRHSRAAGASLALRTLFRGLGSGAFRRMLRFARRAVAVRAERAKRFSRLFGKTKTRRSQKTGSFRLHSRTSRNSGARPFRQGTRPGNSMQTGRHPAVPLSHRSRKFGMPGLLDGKTRGRLPRRSASVLLGMREHREVLPRRSVRPDRYRTPLGGDTDHTRVNGA
ncbi:hypothetical protein SDC9_191637 [bioreactor metagenome]|uniref:Uncharacterized protein n=1 Tax=bioreactor metagenome TaxID=1076179 RepID=A0A645HZQ6_9ZZZZ